MTTSKYLDLRKEYDSVTDEKSRIHVLVEMALEVRNFDIEQAEDIADEVISRSKKAGFRYGLGRGYNLKGWCYWQQGNYDAGLIVIEKAYNIAREIRNRSLEAKALNNFGRIYRDKGELAKSLSNFETALSINEDLGDEVAQSVNLSNIAGLNYDLGDFETALEFALKCLPSFEAARDTIRLTGLYQILGNIYFKLENLDEALRYFIEILNETEPDTTYHIMAISSVGKVYYKLNEFDNARTYLQDALEQSKEAGNVEIQIICHFYTGRLLIDEGNYKRALQEMNIALQLSDLYMRKHDVMSVHEMLSVIYDKMDDIPKAFYHLKAFEKLKEEIFKQTTLSKLRNLQVRQQVELAKKEKEVAERTAQLKQQFMANMSHEIRTPMNAIVGITRLLLNQEPRQEQLRYLKAIQQSADNLLVIINDILDISKIEAGKIAIEETTFSLQSIVDGLKDMMLIKAEEKKLDLFFKIDPAIPPLLKGDPTRVSQVLVNLMGNAVKFTEKGYVELNMFLSRRDDEKYYVQMELTDTGIGIAQDYIDIIFESFTQAGTDTARRFGGTGLGLTISRQLVSLMQGEINVKSEEGKGTIFTVVIPFEEGNAEELEERRADVKPNLRERLQHAKVLLVEDNDFNRMVAEDTLKEVLPNIQIDIAVNGQKAVDMVRNNSYDIILMDIQMPVMDGVTATKIIRNELTPPASMVKIIAMTANVLQEDVKLYKEAGMDAYVSKPFQTDELLAKMALMLSDEAEKTETNAMTDALPPVKEAHFLMPAHVTDLHFLQQFASGKQDKIKKYINMFLENAPRLLNAIDDAMIARDFTEIKIAAHSLKPQLGYMGVKEEVSHIFLIEQTASESGHFDRLLPLVKNLKKVCVKAFEELQQND